MIASTRSGTPMPSPSEYLNAPHMPRQMRNSSKSIVSFAASPCAPFWQSVKADSTSSAESERSTLAASPPVTFGFALTFFCTMMLRSLSSATSVGRDIIIFAKSETAGIFSRFLHALPNSFSSAPRACEKSFAGSACISSVLSVAILLRFAFFSTCFSSRVWKQPGSGSSTALSPVSPTRPSFGLARLSAMSSSRTRKPGRWMPSE